MAPIETEEQTLALRLAEAQVAAALTQGVLDPNKRTTARAVVENYRHLLAELRRTGGLFAEPPPKDEPRG
jgi:hypothetical protein